MLKGILKNREFRLHDELEGAITMAWNDLTFDEVQGVFHNWMNRFRWSLRTGESTLLNKGGSVYLCLLSDGIGGGTRDFLYPLYVPGVRRVMTFETISDRYIGAQIPQS
jgi:hypothetical protein